MVTPFTGSWADEEFRRRHKPVIRNDITTGFKDEIIAWEPIHLPLPEWWGTPNILIRNTVLLGPIDPKWARVFNG